MDIGECSTLVLKYCSNSKIISVSKEVPNLKRCRDSFVLNYANHLDPDDFLKEQIKESGDDMIRLMVIFEESRR